VAKPQYTSASRFVLLTYNLTCLYWCVVGTGFEVLRLTFHETVIIYGRRRCHRWTWLCGARSLLQSV
jgi:hypothetical protein